MPITKIAWNTPAEQIAEFLRADLTGKVAIVTGSNSGIGLESARVFSLVGAKVIIPCRTLEKSKSAIQHIQKTVPQADLIPMQLDLCDLGSIRRFAHDFLSLNLPLHILLNNAGVMACPKSFTKDGFETQFGVNHLGHFYLTNLLTGKLKESAPARVINVSSSAHYFCENSPHGIDFDNLNGEKGYNSFKIYGQSKLANILHAKELQRRFDVDGVDILVCSLHPGIVHTNLTRHTSLSVVKDVLLSMRHFMDLFRQMRTKMPAVGASTQVYCALSSDIVKGEYYSDNAVEKVLLHKEIDNTELAQKLWKVSEKMLDDKNLLNVA